MSEAQTVSEDRLGNLTQTQVTKTKNLQRRTSIQKIIHMCNQSAQVFPHAFLWVQVHIHKSSLYADVRNIIPLVKSFMALRLGVYLSIAFLSAELLYCMVAVLTFLLPSASAFFFICIGILLFLTLQIFDVAIELRKKLRGSFFVKKKKIN